MKKEVWKDIKGFNHWYQVSSHGRVRRLVDRYRNRLSIPRLVPFEKWRRGYLRVTFHHNKTEKHYSVARLVLLTFRPIDGANRYHAAHLNGILTDNRLCNLKWVTPKENNSHKILHGTAQIGSKHGCAVLTEADIPKIINLRKQGLSLREIGDIFGVTKFPIWSIIRGRTWKHVFRHQ